MQSILNQARAGLWLACAWFLEIAFCPMSVCVCVSAPEAINYIHVILNLYKQLNRFVTFINVAKQLFVGMAIVTKCVMKPT